MWAGPALKGVAKQKVRSHDQDSLQAHQSWPWNTGRDTHHIMINMLIMSSRHYDHYVGT
jgi:hypothetical protein